MSETTAPEDTDLLTSIAGAMDGLADVLDDDAAFDAPEEAEAVETPEAPAEEAAAADESQEVVAPEASADPLADAKPFEYTVDGQAKTYDGIKVLANADGSIQGAIIQPDAIKDVQYRLQRGEYLEGQNKALYEKARDYDAVTFRSRADGTEHKGMAAVEQYALENARQGAALQVLADVLENPDKLVALAIAVQSGDTSGLQALTERIALIAENATFKARSEFGQRITQHKEQAATVQDRGEVTTKAISGAVTHWASQFPQLTAEDKDKAVAYFSKLGSHVVRPATPDEAKAAGVKPGELIIDHPVVFEYLQDRAELRKQASASTTAASAAAKENAARLASAARGKTKAPAPTKGKRQTVPAEPEGETWAQQKARMMAGQFADSDE